MKRLLLAAALLMGGVAHAEDENVHTCELVHRMATTVMGAYQGGVPIVQALSVADKSELMRAMVLEAYDSTRYTPQDFQQRAIERFANEWAVACYKQMEGDK
jgi:hypothetical protein